MSDVDFLQQDAVTVAQALLGWRFYKRSDGQLVGGIIVETEAYMANDAASHSYKGMTPRTSVMFGAAGHIYVYFTYGMHYCANIVTGPIGSGEAVLLRAIVPDQGLDTIKQRRGQKPDHMLTNGPAKLCQALNITLDDNGQQINTDAFVLLPPLQPVHRQAPSRRIGISKNTEILWRFTAIL